MGANVTARLPGWESRMAQIIDAYRDLPYQLGRCDCFSLACAVFHALRGVDHWPTFAGRYSTLREAIALIAAHGHTFEDAMVCFGGLERAPVLQAQRGDLVLYRDDNGMHLTVCVGAMVAAYGPSGLVFLPLSDPGLRTALKV